MKNTQTILAIIVLGGSMLASAAHAGNFEYEGRSTSCPETMSSRTTLRLKFSGGTSPAACTYYRGEPDKCERMDFWCPPGNDYVRRAYVSLANNYKKIELKYVPSSTYPYVLHLTAYAVDKGRGTAKTTTKLSSGRITTSVSTSFAIKSATLTLSAVQE